MSYFKEVGAGWISEGLPLCLLLLEPVEFTNAMLSCQIHLASVLRFLRFEGEKLLSSGLQDVPYARRLSQGHCAPLQWQIKLPKLSFGFATIRLYGVPM